MNDRTKTSRDDSNKPREKPLAERVNENLRMIAERTDIQFDDIETRPHA